MGIKTNLKKNWISYVTFLFSLIIFLIASYFQTSSFVYRFLIVLSLFVPIVVDSVLYSIALKKNLSVKEYPIFHYLRFYAVIIPFLFMGFYTNWIFFTDFFTSTSILLSIIYFLILMIIGKATFDYEAKAKERPLSFLDILLNYLLYFIILIILLITYFIL